MVKAAIAAMRPEMKFTKDAMLPQSAIEKELLPEAEGIEPLPETNTERLRTSEAYSEGGLSGEAALDKTAPNVMLETEPFMRRQRTDEEVADYDKGFESGQEGAPNDDTKSEAWQRGWADAQE
jgi:hypothetical protein